MSRAAARADVKVDDGAESEKRLPGMRGGRAAKSESGRYAPRGW